MIGKLMRQIGVLARLHMTKKAVSQYIINYLLVIIIGTVLLATVTYQFGMNKAKQNVIDANNVTLLNFQKTIDSFILQNIDNISLDILSSDKPYIDLFTQPVMKNSQKIMDIRKGLVTLCTFNPLITEIAIYYRSEDAIISQNGVFFLADDGDKSHYTDTDWLSFLDTMAGSSDWMETRRDENLKKDIITMVRKYGYTGSPYLGGIAISIDEDKLHSLITSYAPESLQALFIVNGNGEIISHADKGLIATAAADLPYGTQLLSKGSEPGYFLTEQDGKKIVVSYTPSSYNDWTYVSVNELSRMTAQYRFFNMVVILFVGAALLIGLVILMPSARRISLASREVHTLSDIVQEQRNEIRKNQGVVKQNFILNLLNGIYERPDEIQTQLDLLEIEHPYPETVAVVIKLYGENTADTRVLEYTKLKIIEHAEALFTGQSVECLSTQSKKNVILLLNFRDGMENCRSGIEKICDYIRQELGFQAVAGVGAPCDSLFGVPESYQQALLCIDYGYILDDSTVIGYEEILPREESHSEIPVGYLERFENQLLARDKKEALQSVYEMLDDMRQNLYPFNKCMSMIQRSVAILENFQKRAARDGDPGVCDDLFYSFRRCESLSDFISLVANILDSLLGYGDSAASSRSKALIENVRQYIKKNIANEMVTLKTVAESFDISPNYLSHIFKEETGMYFIDYLIEARLEMSRKLLRDTELGVAEIARMTGYASQLYYGRKFKARYGMTPKQYRDSVVREKA